MGNLIEHLNFNAINIKNGNLNKNGYLIDIEDLNEDSVELKVDGYTNNLYNIVIY